MKMSRKMLCLALCLALLLTALPCALAEETAAEGGTRRLRLGSSIYTIVLDDSYVYGEVREEELADDMIAYLYSDERAMDIDVYQFSKSGLPGGLADYVNEEAGYFESVSELVPEDEINDIPVGWYRTVEEYDGEYYKTITFILDNGDEYVDVVFWLDSEEEMAEVEAVMETLSYVDVDIIQLGTSPYNMLGLSGFVEGELTEEDIADDQVAYWYSEETLLDFDVYQFSKEGEPADLADYVIKEAGEYESVSELMTDQEVNGIPVGWYRTTEEFDGVDYETVTVVMDNGDEYVEVVFWIDGQTAASEANSMLQSLWKETGDAAAEEDEAEAEEAEPAAEEAEPAEEEAEPESEEEAEAEVEEAEPEAEEAEPEEEEAEAEEEAEPEKDTWVEAEPEVEEAEPAEEEEAKAEEEEAESEEEVDPEKDVWVEAKAIAEGAEVEEEAEAEEAPAEEAEAEADGEDEADAAEPEGDEPEAAETYSLQLGTSPFFMEVPVGFVEGELTEADIADDQVAYYYSNDTLMDFDVYQFSKKGYPDMLADYVVEESEGYTAVNDLVTDGEINGIPVASYRTIEEYEEAEYETITYILDDGFDYVDVVFWLDGETAEAEAAAIINTLSLDSDIWAASAAAHAEAAQEEPAGESGEGVDKVAEEEVVEEEIVEEEIVEEEPVEAAAE